MFLRRVFLFILVAAVVYASNLGLAKFSPASAHVQACSCTSYYGVPHSCYYSPNYDYDYSCYAKCVREANQ